MVLLCHQIFLHILSGIMQTEKSVVQESAAKCVGNILAKHLLPKLFNLFTNLLSAAFWHMYATSENGKERESRVVLLFFVVLWKCMQNLYRMLFASCLQSYPINGVHHILGNIHADGCRVLVASWEGSFLPVLQKGMDIKRGCDLSEVRENM